MIDNKYTIKMILNTQLIIASKDGHLETVKYLVEDCEVNVHVYDDCAVRWAAQNGHLEIVKYLVEDHGANVHADDDYALRYATCNGHLEVVKYFVEDCEVNVHVYDALRWAAQRGHLEVVKYLVEDCEVNVHADDDYAFHWAVYYGHIEVVKYLKSYIVLLFTKKHIDKQRRIEKLNQVLKGIRALPGIGIDYLYAFEHFNHLKTTIY